MSASSQHHRPRLHLDEALGADGPVLAAIRRLFPEAIAAYAFGSQVTGLAGPDSDLDLAVLVPGYADPLQLWDAASQVADVVGCEVDLLDFRAASTVMQYEILQHGRLLFGRQPATGLYECFVLSEKLDLDAARAGLLADIAANGAIHHG